MSTENIKKPSFKRKFFTYSNEAVKRALNEIRINNMGVREASRQFGVPKTTLLDKLAGRTSENKARKTGPSPILTCEGEKKNRNMGHGTGKMWVPH